MLTAPVGSRAPTASCSLAVKESATTAASVADAGREYVSAPSTESQFVPLPAGESLALSGTAQGLGRLDRVPHQILQPVLIERACAV